MSKRIEVETDFGKLVAETYNDEMYPGIWLSIELDGEVRQLALVEATPDYPVDGLASLRLNVWADEDNEDYTHNFTFEQIKSGRE